MLEHIRRTIARVMRERVSMRLCDVCRQWSRHWSVLPDGKVRCADCCVIYTIEQGGIVYTDKGGA